MKPEIAELHRDEARRAREFPVVQEGIFLAHAGVCPLPGRVAQAMSTGALEAAKGDQESVFPAGTLHSTKVKAAALLGCVPQEVALIGSTSIGLSMVAEGLEWKPGENVVFLGDDFPSNVVPWLALEPRGVEPRPIFPKRMGAVEIDDLRKLVDGKTKLVSLPSAHFISGHRLAMEEIGPWLKEKGVLFCVDGIQTVGAIHGDLRHVDFLAADAHKWLLGPCASGILYVRKESQEKLRPLMLGWNNVRCPDYIAPESVAMETGARRYEAGSHNLIGVLGLHAALSLLDEYGAKEIEETVLGHTRFLRDQLRTRGFELAGCDETKLSGITSFTATGNFIKELHRKLGDLKMHTSLRQTRDGRSWLRLSPHFYNTREELDKVISAIGVA
jgi:cysteine desulfurase / selenocysteine lyase